MLADLGYRELEFFGPYPFSAPEAQASWDAVAPRLGCGLTAGVHAAEIEYALGNLDRNQVFAWTADDHRVSEIMQGYFASVLETGDPNGPGLPRWSPLSSGEGAQVLRIEVDPRAQRERRRQRFLFLDQLYMLQPSR